MPSQFIAVCPCPCTYRTDYACTYEYCGESPAVAVLDTDPVRWTGGALCTHHLILALSERAEAEDLYNANDDYAYGSQSFDEYIRTIDKEEGIQS